MKFYFFSLFFREIDLRLMLLNIAQRCICSSWIAQLYNLPALYGLRLLNYSLCTILHLKNLKYQIITDDCVTFSRKIYKFVVILPKIPEKEDAFT